MTCTAAQSRVESVDRNLFERLFPQWEALTQRTYDNRLFQTPLWNRTWWEHFGLDSSRIVTYREDDSAVLALLPLQVEERDGERILTLLGDYNVADYMDALAEKDRARELLAAVLGVALAELEWDRVELRHVPSTSVLIRTMQEVAPEHGLTVSIEQDEVCPIALLCSSWGGYLQMLSKKQRHEIRRKLRRAQEGVEWDWRIARTREELDRDLPVFFRLHESSAREKHRFMTPNMRAYFTDMARIFLDADVLRLGIFRRDGVDVAATMSFLYRDRYLLYNSGYDPAYAAKNPGIAAVVYSMQDAIEAQAVAFDFLSGDEPYKYQFGAANTHTCRVTAARR